MDDHRPVSKYFLNAPTDEQIRADVNAALDDERVREAFRLLRCCTPTLPFASIICAVFDRWDTAARDDKLRTIAEFVGMDVDWLQPAALYENIAAWERPWDDMRERKDGAP